MLHVNLLADRKIIQETLTRIGIASYNSNILYPSAYLFTCKGKDYIAHFKELFKYINDDVYEDFQLSDEHRLNSIVWLLQSWKLIECLDELGDHSIKVDCIKFSEKNQWLIKNKIKIRNIESKLE